MLHASGTQFLYLCLSDHALVKTSTKSGMAKILIFFCGPVLVLTLACENSRPSSLPARMAFRVKERNAIRTGSDEGRLFSQAILTQIFQSFA